MLLTGEFSTLSPPTAKIEPCKSSFFTLLGEEFLSFTLIQKVEVPDLHEGLLSCDFTIEDTLDMTNYLREQM